MNKLVIGSSLEQEAMSVKSLIEFQKRNDLGDPTVITLSVLSAKGFVVYPTMPSALDPYFPYTLIEEDALLAPDALLNEGNSDLGKVLRPCFDAIWQASGWPGSPGYDDEGKRIGFVQFFGQ